MPRKTARRITEEQRAFIDFRKARGAFTKAIRKARKLPPDVQDTFLNKVCYAAFAKFYRQHMRRHHEVFGSIMSDFIKSGHIQESGAFLDCAGGDGSQYFIDLDSKTNQTLIPLAQYLKEKRIPLIFNDLSPAMLEAARQNFSGSDVNVTFTNYDVRDLARKYAGTYKIRSALCSYCIHGFPEPKVISVRGFVDALEPGGRVFDLQERRAGVITIPKTLDKISGDILFVATMLLAVEKEIGPESLKILYTSKCRLEYLEQIIHAVDDTPDHDLIGNVYEKPMGDSV